jgi:hypothetical protein
MTTMTDLKCALDAHIECLARCGITYDGRLGLDEGSKLYGRAFRLYLTDKLDRCQTRRFRDADTGETYRYAADVPGTLDRSFAWDHDGCEECQGTRQSRCSGHYNPPVGDDFLGMTKTEAYETLTARTRAIYDTAAAVKP